MFSNIVFIAISLLLYTSRVLQQIYVNSKYQYKWTHGIGCIHGIGGN